MLSPLDAETPPSPPPPPPETFKPIPAVENSGGTSTSSPSSSSFSYIPSLPIIAAILAFVFLASASIHLLLRLLSSSRSSSSSSSASSRLLLHRSFSSTTTNSSTPPPPPQPPSDRDPKSLIESLPLFTFASSLAALPKSSPDCAVCLSAFSPHDELRLLPACRHAFHSRCIDIWLVSTPSCPLCRSSILLPPPAPPPPPLETAVTAEPDREQSSSFRIEIGSVSRRMTTSAVEDSDVSGPHLRTYSLGSSFEYLVEEELEAVVARVVRQLPEKPEITTDEEKPEFSAPGPPGEEVAEVVGGGGSGVGARGWLRDYVDRLASRSSSFSSFRLSVRDSRRFDSNAAVANGGSGDGWDVEAAQQYRSGEDIGYTTSFYRWLIGVS